MAEKEKIDGFAVPQWVYVGALLLGLPIAGGGGTFIGANTTRTDLEELSEKVEKLDGKIDRLTLAIVRANPDIDIGP